MERLLTKEEYLKARNKYPLPLFFHPVTVTCAETAIMQAQDAKTTRLVAEEIFEEIDRWLGEPLQYGFRHFIDKIDAYKLIKAKYGL